MTKKFFALCLTLGISSVLAEEADIGFQGSLPENSPWKNIGSIPVESVDEGGVRALAFVDESETDFPALYLPIDTEVASRMLEQGYTMDIRLKHVLEAGSGGNFNFILRLPGISGLQITPYRNASKGNLGIGVHDPEIQSNRNALWPSGEEFVSVRAIFRPAGENGSPSCEILLGGEHCFHVSLPPSQRNEPPGIELGGKNNAAERTGATYIESFKLSIP